MDMNLSHSTLKEPSARWYAMDALRAFAMLLGIFFHGSLAYTLRPFPNWPIHDIVKNEFFDAFVFILHLFRMELFFCISGFFTYQLCQKRSLFSFIKNRILRILIPFLIGWPITTLILFSIPFKEAPNLKLTGIPLYHLWFLYYLLIFYGMVIVFKVIAKTSHILFQKNLMLFLDKLFLRLFQHKYHLLLLAGFTFPCLFGMKKTVVNTPLYFLTNPSVLLYYSLFFICGWMISRQPFLLQTMIRTNKIYRWSALPAVTFVTYSFLRLNMGFHISDALILFTRFLYAVSTWSLMLWFIGFFHQKIQQEYAFIRILANASYWIYLAHFPLIIILQNQFSTAPLPGLLKPASVIALTFGILMTIYVSFKANVYPHPVPPPQAREGI